MTMFSVRFICGLNTRGNRNLSQAVGLKVKIFNLNVLTRLSVIV